MEFQGINRSDPEKVFIIVKNDEASNAFIKGAPVCFQFDTVDDGLAAVRSATGAAARSTTLCTGIANEATAAGKYGLVQVYGVRDDAQVASAGAVAIGDIMAVASGSNHLSRSAAGAEAANAPLFAAGATLASTNVSSTTTVFIRCL